MERQDLHHCPTVAKPSPSGVSGGHMGSNNAESPTLLSRRGLVGSLKPHPNWQEPGAHPQSTDGARTWISIPLWQQLRWCPLCPHTVMSED